MSDIKLSKMGRKRVRAQRKFAQGAYIPPQNNPATSAPAVPPQASHRAVSVGPVIVNKCNVRDLITRLSLERGHFHGILPVVRLEYNTEDYKKKTPNKKIKDKSNLKTPPKKKTRRQSVSESGEDNIPLSYLVTAAVEEPTEPSIPLKGVLKKTKPQTAISKKCKKSKVSIDSSKSLTLNKTVSVAIEESPEVIRAMTVTFDNSCAVTACSSQNQKGGKDLQQKKKVHSSASSLSPKTIPSSSVTKSKKRPPDTSLEELNKELCAICPEKQLKQSMQLRLRRFNKTYRDNNFAYGSISDVSSIPISIDSRIRDPDYEVESESRTKYSTLNTTKRLNASKRKSENNQERLGYQLKTTKTIAKNASNNEPHEKRADTRAVDTSDLVSVSGFSSISSQMAFYGFNTEEELENLRYDDDEPGHFHEILPVVRLEYNTEDYKKKTPNKKIKDKSSLKTPQKKKTYCLRNRRQSVSESGEDNIPLSYLVTAAVEEPTEPSIPLKGVLKKTKPQTAISKKCKKSKVSIDSSKSLTPNKTVSVAIEESPEVIRAMTVTFDNSCAVTACSSQNQKGGKDLLQKKEVHSSASSLSPKTIPSSSVTKSKKRPPDTSLEELNKELCAICPEKQLKQSMQLRLRRFNKTYRDNNFAYGSISDVSSIPISIDSRIRDPDYEVESESRTKYSTLNTTKRLNASKRKSENNQERLGYQLKTTKTIAKNASNNEPHEKRADTRAVDTSDLVSVSGFSSISSQMALYGFDTEEELENLRYDDDEPENGDSFTVALYGFDTEEELENLRYDDYEPENGDLLLSLNATYEQTADWVRTHHYQVNNAALSNLENDTSPTAALGETNTIVPGSGILPTPACVIDVSTYGGSRRISLNTYKNLVPGGISNSPSTPEQDIASDNTFKIPDLPARFVKLTKNCPTRVINNLQDLLNSPPDEEARCRMCRRCDLLMIYKQVSSQLPSSDANEPDILEMLPRDEYEFDADDEGIKLLRRGRELVRNVLTTKRCPIWLSNMEMPLQKNMFQNAHKLGTLKRTLQLDTDKGTDTIVNKIITRVDYLSLCLSEDKKELDLETSRQRLRSTKPSQSKSISRKRRKKVKQSKTPRRRRKQPVPIPVNTDNSKDMPATSSSGVVEPQPIVYLLHLEDDPELGEHHRTTPPAANSPLDEVGTEIIDDTVRQLGPDNTNEAPATSTYEKISPVASTSRDQQAKQTNSKKTLSSLKSPSSLANNSEVNNPSPSSKMEGAPVFRPTLEQFQDPITYIKSIEGEASKYGICKIVPPKEFVIPCHLDDEAVFSTMNQFLGRLYQRWGPNTREMTALQTYLAMIASPKERDQFTKVPLFEGVELDLVKLYHLVLEEGGIAKLLAHSENWARIAEHMSLVLPRGKPDAKKLEKLYCKHVLPYESLSNEERNSNLKKVDKIWSERSQSAIRRAKRPLHYTRSALGETTSDDDEPPLDPDTELERTIGKPCFDRAEECTAKGRTINLAAFRRIGAQIQAMRFGKTQPSTLDIEEEYWNILKKGNEHVCVLSAFIDTSVDNLGHTADPEDPGGKHPWNLKRLGENLQNILRPLGKILSVTVPTLALNQLFSTNCWHMDPHQLAWMDFMHEGATKIWYAVPRHGSNKLRHAVASIIPSAAQNKGIWLASDTTMVPLEMLLDRGVPVFRLEQNPGEFIVVFPGAYASSIATGLTISESIYFEDKSYLFKINKIFQELRQDCEPAMFSSTLLLLRMARDVTITYDMLRYVYASLDKLIKEELELRLAAVKRKCWIQLDESGRASGQEAPISWPNQEECSHCRSPLILSKMYRYNNTRSLMCLSHGLRIYAKAPVYETGEPAAVTLLYSNEELQSELTALADRILSAA